VAARCVWQDASQVSLGVTSFHLGSLGVTSSFQPRVDDRGSDDVNGVTARLMVGREELKIRCPRFTQLNFSVGHLALASVSEVEWRSTVMAI